MQRIDLSRRRFLHGLSTAGCTLGFSNLLLLGCRTTTAGANLAAAHEPVGAGELSVRASVTDPGNANNLQLYTKAVAAMKAANFPTKLKDQDGQLRTVTWWEAHALTHQNGCPHSNWFFLPWHRAYLYYFEKTCRVFCEDQSFALPYWDWSADGRVPEPFWGDTSNPLFDKRAIDQNTPVPDTFVGSSAVDNITGLTDFLAFGSGRAPETRPGRGSTGQLEGTPHNHVHAILGGDDGDMGDFMSPLDPIFWLHHCNVDRLWAVWQSNMSAKSLPTLPPQPPSFGSQSSLTADYWLKYKVGPFYDVQQDRTVQNGQMTVQAVQQTADLQYRYSGHGPLSTTMDAHLPREMIPVPRSDSLTLSVSRAPQALMAPANPDAHIARELDGSKPDLTLTIDKSSGLVALLSKYKDAWDATDRLMNVRLVANKIVAPASRTDATLHFYLNASGPLSPDSSNYIGSYTLFAQGHHHGSGSGATVELSVMFNLQRSLQRLSEDDATIFDDKTPLTISVATSGSQAASLQLKDLTLGLDFDA